MFEEFGNDCLSLVACAMIISIVWKASCTKETVAYW